MLTKTKETYLYDIDKMSETYDRIYAIADRLLKKHNPCNIHRTKTGKLYCNMYDKKNESSTGKLCCVGCSNHNTGQCYWSPTGCTTNALACKLFSCTYMRGKRIRHNLYRLRQLAAKYLIFYYWENESKEYSWAYNIGTQYYMPKQTWLDKLKDKQAKGLLRERK